MELIVKNNVINMYSVQLNMKCFINEFSNIHYLHLKRNDVLYKKLKVHHGIKILKNTPLANFPIYFFQPIRVSIPERVPPRSSQLFQASRYG